MRGSAIIGPLGAVPDDHVQRRRILWLSRSLAVRLIFLIGIFLIVPLLIYNQFKAADQEKQVLLKQSAQLQGELIARSLQSSLQSAENPIPAEITAHLSRLVDDRARIRLLVRPSQIDGAQGFFYVAAVPSVPRALLDTEREHLIRQGILGRLGQTCSGNLPLALRVPTETGGEEVLTSITPINTDFGCWALVTSHVTEAYLGSAIGQPYWKTPELQAAALIYFGMAFVVLAIFFDVWRNLVQFGRLARRIGFSDMPAEGSFAAQNRVPELDTVAQDFDRLVETLRQSAEAIRRTAEDNAHAFKTPLGIIRQSLEPMKRAIGDEPRGRRAAELTEQAVTRLDNLVSCAQHLDEATADLMTPATSQVDLADLLERMVTSYAQLHAASRLQFIADLDHGMKVRASEDLLETVVEIIVDNAASFSPRGGRIEITARRNGRRAVMRIEDEGPGVSPPNLERIFERYFSDRRIPQSYGENSLDVSPAHFGIGLWIARQNVEAVGGRVWAENRLRGGLCVQIELPLAT